MVNTVEKRQLILYLFLASFLGGLIALGTYTYFIPREKYTSIEERQNIKFAKNKYLLDTAFATKSGLNFVYASELVCPAVVHIKVQAERKSRQTDIMEELFNQFGGGQFKQRPIQSSGSGVIITDNGYIATNNHVIDGATEIKVVLNDKRSYTARIIGQDPNTDLALIKIEETGLPFVKYGDSDKLRVGEWVLAIGNPFDLTSTVTAGIVSAKARGNLDLLRFNRETNQYNNYAIESFIQTDAAVNPGNSGGALVNLKGELVGINTAIASRTGSYEGYSFAVPVRIVKKVMEDLMKYGETQRALLGVSISDISAEFAEKKGIKKIRGVYVQEVNPNSAAEAAGIKPNDIILAIDGQKVNSVSELQGIVGTYRPGDKITILYERNGVEKTTQAVLKSISGSTQITAKENTGDFGKNRAFGAEFAPASISEKESLGIDNGVKVVSVSPGKFKDAGVRPGFIITRAGEDGKSVNSPQELIDMLKNKKRLFPIEGYYPNGDKAYYIIP
ncbi:MAG: Do family serine endopeptidase [Microscillaceae bacterium]|nr:Do family serine endopeptidase [Microscillaceae bacterium]MDW8459906.1 Do family serine endopeptidase [Cytophagales bacterium]